MDESERVIFAAIQSIRNALIGMPVSQTIDPFDPQSKIIMDNLLTCRATGRTIYLSLKGLRETFFRIKNQADGYYQGHALLTSGHEQLQKQLDEFHNMPFKYKEYLPRGAQDHTGTEQILKQELETRQNALERCQGLEEIINVRRQRLAKAKATGRAQHRI